MRTVIIDDEPKCRQTLKNFSQKYATALQIVGEADSVQSGVALIEDQKPELVFLDIKMPDGTGFDLLGQLQYSDFQLIFCTSFDNYAVKAFRFSAIDYLLKPLDPDIFRSAVSKVLENNDSKLAENLEVLDSNKNEFTRIALHSSNGIDLVNLKDIIRCESRDNYTVFFLANKKVILVTKTLKEFDELLSENGFFRIHKSHLVNLSHINRYVKGDGGQVIMSDESAVEVSRRKKEALLSLIAKH